MIKPLHDNIDETEEETMYTQTKILFLALILEPIVPSVLSA